MRLLYLTHNIAWKGGGVFYTAYHQGRHLVARGHEVTLMCVSPKAKVRFHEYMSEGVRIIETPDLLQGKARTGWDPWDILQRICYLRHSHYDLVHGYESRPVVALPALYLKHRKNIPMVLTWADWFGHGGKGSERGRYLKLVMDPLETFCEDFFYPRADRCIVMGTPLLEHALSLGLDPNRMMNLLHGCDPERIKVISIQDARDQLSRFSLPQKGTVFGYLGVLRESSAELLFKAFSLIRPHINGQCKLLFIGNHKLNLSEYIPSELREDVIQTGWLSYQDVNLCLSACDILMLPLKKVLATDNVWPSKLNDYLAAGRPVLATNMRILTSVFEKYQVGLLATDEPQAYADACLHLLGNPSICVGMGQNARQLAEGDLSWSSIVDRLEQFYTGLISTYH